MTTVVFDTDDIRALERAHRALQAEQALLERHKMVSVELDDDVLALDNLIDRMKAEQRDLRARLASSPPHLTSLEAWKREYARQVKAS